MALNYKTGNPEKSEFFVPPGDYSLRVIEAKEDTSRRGNDQIKLKLRVLKPDGSEGPALFDYLVFTDASFWKIDHFLKSCGEHPGAGENVEIDVNKIVGWVCRATLAVEEYNGNKSNKVSAYLWEDEF